jgi:hypothetical protein
LADSGTTCSTFAFIVTAGKSPSVSSWRVISAAERRVTVSQRVMACLFHGTQRKEWR